MSSRKLSQPSGCSAIESPACLEATEAEELRKLTRSPIRLGECAPRVGIANVIGSLSTRATADYESPAAARRTSYNSIRVRDMSS